MVSIVKLLAAALVLAPTLASSRAFAQSVPPPPPLPPGTVLPNDFCALGDHAGIDETDAQTTSSIVCEEVRRHPNLPSGRHYRVHLYRLGSRVFLSVQAEQPLGTLLDRRQMQLAQIEEVPVVAPRLVSALLENKALRETETVANIAGEDTRVRKKKTGEAMLGLGVAATYVPGVAAAGPGFILGVHYEADAFSIGSEMRLSGGESGRDSFTHFTMGIGGRWFTSQADVTPVVGGGLQAQYLSLESGNFDGNKFGVGAYGEAGIEALRTHRVRVLATARADIPFFNLDDVSYNASSGNRLNQTRFTIPLSLNTALYFHW